MPIFASNFASNSLSGVATVIAGNVTINLTPAAFALEGDRTFVVKLRKGSDQAAVIATSPVVTIKDRTTFVSLTANTATVHEGNLVAFSLVTTNVLNGVTVYYSVLPATANVTADDFTSNTGSIVITNNAATFALQANINIAPVDETGENFKVQLRTNSPTGNIVFATSNVEILDTYKTYNVYQFAESTNQVYDTLNTANVTFTVGATNIPNGTVLYYNTVGNVTSFYSNTGSFVMNSTSNTFTITNPEVPFLAAGFYNVVLRDGSPSGAIVATSNNIIVNDNALMVVSASGGVQSNVAGYRIHTFTSSSNLTILSPGQVEYLVIAGGGGGGAGGTGGDPGSAGAGGAGGFRTATGFSVSSGAIITVTVGAGGTGGPGNSVNGSRGANTAFSTITAAGGGYGGTIVQPGGAGGSGGGGGGRSATSGGAGNTPAVTPSQGNSGGGGGTGSGGAGGGGGGAGAAGGNAITTTGGTGGNGANSSITGSSVTYAGGGGGGAIAGSGGGGAVSTPATVNTGGGGGGGGNPGSGGNGGSGIVIIRYRPNAAAFVDITTPAAFAYEGQPVIFTLNTTDVSNNTLLYYYTVGNVISSDFVTGNTGSFRTTNDSTTITLATNSNIPANEERFFQFRIAGDAGTGQSSLKTSNVFTIKDSNLKPNATAFQYLIVAGGGGGNPNSYAGGGGGGGGVLLGNANVTVGYTYVVAIGGGGGLGTNGGNSSILINSSNIAAYGGGGGSDSNRSPTTPGIPGGSGGGGGTTGGVAVPSVSGGTGISGQGFAGGGSTKMIPGQQAGGGGGAGGVGQPASTVTTFAGAGGIGIYSSLSGTRTGYAGGGGAQCAGGDPGGNYAVGGAFGLSSPEWTSLTSPAFGSGGSASFISYNAVAPAGSGNYTATTFLNGVTNTGGGATGGGTGGSGVAIIATPDSVKTATATTGSPNVIYANNNIIYRFWQSGSITF